MKNHPEKPQDFRPYLSVVAASRNDDHGGDPLIRTQIFITNFARQCEKYCLPAELIIVDWNPVPGRPGLAAVLKLPVEVNCVQARVITVPTALHQRFKYAEGMPLLQMIAKNVGIRRATGRFVLTTNIDILFSDELIQFIALRCLDRGKLYRVDRYDIQSGLTPETSLDEVLKYAWGNVMRAHHRYQPETLVRHLYGEELCGKVCVPNPEFRGRIEDVNVVEEDNVWQIRPDRSVDMFRLHTNGCGDFTLMSRAGWEAIRGYPEVTGYSFNVDSMGLIAAHYAGYGEVSLLPPCVCFHIEHGLGSGWTPGSGEKALFKRLRDADILIPEWPVLMPLVDEMRMHSKALLFNHAGWGMIDFDLPEQAMGDPSEIPADTLAHLALQAEKRSVCAIQPAYDLDRLTLAYERRVAAHAVQEPRLATNTEQEQRVVASVLSTVAAPTERVVLYIPDSYGNFSEEGTLVYQAQLTTTIRLVFRLEKFDPQFLLRFDPCECPSLIRIKSLTALDISKNRLLWDLDGRHVNKLGINGTAEWAHLGPAGGNITTKMFSRSTKAIGRQSLFIVSTGLDPQVMLPPLPKSVGFPLVIAVKMTIVLL